MTRDPTPARDTDASPFAAILADLLSRMPGAFGAALVDEEGECVDYTGRADPFDLKVAAAHFSIVLAEASSCLSGLGRLRTLLVRGAKKTFLVHTLHDRYAMIVLLSRRAGFTASARALFLCECALAKEASWPTPEGQRWYPVRVECRGRRPSRIAADSAGATGQGAPRMYVVEVLGLLVAPDPRERGYRVRLDTGAEVNVVREAGGFWYTDESLPTASARSR